MTAHPIKPAKMTPRQVYNRLSCVYDLFAGSSERQFIDQGLEMLQHEAGGSILEIGCGTGYALEKLISGRKFDQVSGLDISDGMLRVARSRLSSLVFINRSRLVMGDGVSLPCAAGVFSAVFLSFTLELFDATVIPRVLAECWRVLEPNRRLGVVSLLQTEHPGRMVRLYEWMNARFPTYIDCRPIPAEALVQEARFSLEKLKVQSMWGLPVAMLVARKT